jgi:hypothetical protein
MKDTYVHLTCGELTPAQKKKYLKTGKVAFTAAQVKGTSKKIALHPENAKKWKKAATSGKGVNLTLSPGEIHASLAMDGDVLEGSGLEGASVWSWIKKAAKSVYNFAKDNWSDIKPIVSKIADAAVPALATAVGQPGLAIPARGALTQLTGVGVSGKKMTKGSQAMKDHMSRLRSMRKSGGSFRL